MIIEKTKKVLRRFVWEHSPMGEKILSDFDRDFTEISNVNADMLTALEHVKNVCAQHDAWFIGEFINEVTTAITNARKLS